MREGGLTLEKSGGGFEVHASGSRRGDSRELKRAREFLVQQPARGIRTIFEMSLAYSKDNQWTRCQSFVDGVNKVTLDGDRCF